MILPQWAELGRKAPPNSMCSVTQTKKLLVATRICHSAHGGLDPEHKWTQHTRGHKQARNTWNCFPTPLCPGIICRIQQQSGCSCTSWKHRPSAQGNRWTKALHLIQSDRIQSREFQTVLEQLSRLRHSQRKNCVHVLMIHQLEKWFQTFWWVKFNSHIFSKKKKKNKQREKMSLRRTACTTTHQVVWILLLKVLNVVFLSNLITMGFLWLFYLSLWSFKEYWGLFHLFEYLFVSKSDSNKAISISQRPFPPLNHMAWIYKGVWSCILNGHVLNRMPYTQK